MVGPQLVPKVLSSLVGSQGLVARGCFPGVGSQGLVPREISREVGPQGLAPQGLKSWPKGLATIMVLVPDEKKGFS